MDTCRVLALFPAPQAASAKLMLSEYFVDLNLIWGFYDHLGYFAPT